MELYAKKVYRDAAIARRRSLARRAAGPLVWRYLQTVPWVFTACGEFAAFRLLVPGTAALQSLRDRAVLTLDSAAEVLGGFRFTRRGNFYAYFHSPEDLESITEAGIGERRPGTRFPLSWVLPGCEMLFAVVPRDFPPCMESGGFRVVTPEHLVREILGFHGLRTDLLAEMEEKLLRPPR
jgi:hypothetical protein